MRAELRTILDEARALIARGAEPDAAELEARIRALPEHERALDHLQRLLAVHRARRAVATPPRAPARPRAKPPAYRAKPTIASNMAVHARAAGDAVALEWQPMRGVTHWEAKVSERPDARSPYAERETLTLEAPRLELRLTDNPQRVHLFGRNAAGRTVQRALISGLTSANWSQRWQQRATAS